MHTTHVHSHPAPGSGLLLGPGGGCFSGFLPRGHPGQERSQAAGIAPLLLLHPSPDLLQNLGSAPCKTCPALPRWTASFPQHSRSRAQQGYPGFSLAPPVRPPRSDASVALREEWDRRGGQHQDFPLILEGFYTWEAWPCSYSSVGLGKNRVQGSFKKKKI